MKAIVKDVKKMIRKGVRSLKRNVANEVVEKEKEAARLESVIADLLKLADDESTEYPVEVTYSRTAKNRSLGYVTRTEEVTLSDAKDARKAAKKIEKSLAKWAKYREAMLDELQEKQESLASVSSNLSDVVSSWRRLVKELLVTMA